MDDMYKVLFGGVGRFLFLVGSCIAFGFGLYYVLKLKPTPGMEQFLPSAVPLQQVGDMYANQFLAGSVQRGGLPVHFVWGLRNVSREGVSQMTNPTFLGTVDFESGFTFSTPCRKALAQACGFIQYSVDADVEAFLQRGYYGFFDVDCVVQYDGFPRDAAEDSGRMREFMNGGNVRGNVAVGWDNARVRYVGLTVWAKHLHSRFVLDEERTRASYDGLDALRGKLEVFFKKNFFFFIVIFVFFFL